MNYVWYHLKNDPKFWFKVIFIPAVLVIAILDFLSHSFRPPGIFNLWFFKITVMFSIIGFFGYGVFLYVSQRREKKIRYQQLVFEQKREKEFRELITENPEFQTFCFTCVHFNQELKSCTLDIRNPKAKNIQLNENYKYCLYWETLFNNGKSTIVSS